MGDAYTLLFSIPTMRCRNFHKYSERHFAPPIYVQYIAGSLLFVAVVTRFEFDIFIYFDRQYFSPFIANDIFWDSDIYLIELRILSLL